MMPNNTKPQFQVGDIVTCYRRKQTLIYRVMELGMTTWTQQHAQWGQCSQADVGTQFVSDLKLQSIFDLTLLPPKKARKYGFRAGPWQCTKVDPQQIVELMQRLDRFVVDTWP